MPAEGNRESTSSAPRDAKEAIYANIRKHFEGRPEKDLMEALGMARTLEEMRVRALEVSRDAVWEAQKRAAGHDWVDAAGAVAVAEFFQKRAGMLLSAIADIGGRDSKHTPEDSTRSVQKLKETPWF